MSDRPFSRSRNGTFDLKLGRDERGLVSRLLGELRSLLLQPPESDSASAVTRRLFPVVHPADADSEAEYQRLMRDELVASRLAGINTVDAVLSGSGKKVSFDEEQLVAFMQGVNAVRLVLGTLLDVSEDADETPQDDSPLAPEYHLYGFLSWLLDSAVTTLSGI